MSLVSYYLLGYNEVVVSHPECRKKAKKRPGIIMDLEGGGSRRPNCDQLLSYSVIISEIPRHYRQDTYKVNGSNCTWLSAAMLIGRYDSEDGRQMSIQLYNDNNVDKFEYMMVSKNSNQQLHDENDKDSVTQPLSYFVEKYGYMLQRVKKNINATFNIYLTRLQKESTYVY